MLVTEDDGRLGHGPASFKMYDVLPAWDEVITPQVGGPTTITHPPVVLLEVTASVYDVETQESLLDELPEGTVMLIFSPLGCQILGDKTSVQAALISNTAGA